MLSPLDLFKSYFSFKSYFTWFLLASILFGGFLFIKRKNYHTNNNTWKGYLIYFLIIMSILGFGYLCFFYKPQEPSSKYYGQLVNKYDEAIEKHRETLNNFKGLKSEWEKELTITEEELKSLYKQQELNQQQKENTKTLLDQTEIKIKELKDKKQGTQESIDALKEQEKQKQQELDIKNGLITQKELELQQSAANDKKRLQDELDQLRKERQTIVNELVQIEIQIGKMESRKKLYTELIKNAETFQSRLQKRMASLTQEDQNLVGRIEFVKTRKAEIQTEITKTESKMNEITKKIADLEIQRAAAEAAKTACDDWDKKHEFSFGNVRDAVFEAANMYMDAFGGRGFLKAIGGGLTKKVAGHIAKIGLYVHEAHRAIDLVKELFQNPDGTPKMMSKETFDAINKRIDADIARFNADYKDGEAKLEKFRESMKEKNIIKELDDLAITTTKMEQTHDAFVREYANIVNELEEKREEVLNMKNLVFPKNDLEKQLEQKNEEIEVLENETKQTNANWNSFKNKLKQKRYAKFNEVLNSQTSKPKTTPIKPNPPKK